MNLAAKREYVKAIYDRYHLAKKKAKKLILDEFCKVCGFHRKSAIRILNGSPHALSPRKRSAERFFTVRLLTDASEMSPLARREYVRRMQTLYREANGRKAKSRLLDQVGETLGRCRRQAKRLMRCDRNHASLVRGYHWPADGRKERSFARNEETKLKTKRILELLHHKPNLFGINRTSWTHITLSQAYTEHHKHNISPATIGRLIRKLGYRWRKARRALTSPDPDYREKVDRILKTLHELAANELFFFLDEWGPAQVKRRGGKAYYRDKASIPEIPRRQTPKGTVSLVGALSATTNQVTWIFVTSKDSRSMMNMLETLANQYHGRSKLYVTWDAVAWHDSTALMDWLDQFNEETRRNSTGPIIELVPLPISAQFLNVIEGVLSAMTKAVIDNSDYQSPDEMKLAISKHFDARNEHFKKNPRRAGKKIWEIDFFKDFDALRSGDYLNGRRN